MSDKVNLTKLVSKMNLRETRKIKHNLEFYKQPNESVDYNMILKGKTIYSTQTPLFDNERLANLRKVFFLFNKIRKNRILI